MFQQFFHACALQNWLFIQFKADFYCFKYILESGIIMIESIPCPGS